MSSGDLAAMTGATTVAGRRFPPVAELGIGSLALVVIGGILMASYVPRRPPLGLPVALAAVSAALLLAGVSTRRRHPAADARFRSPVVLSSSRTRKPGTLSRLGIAGGAVYDALVALAPRSTGAASRPGTRGHAAPMTHSALR